MMLLRTRAAGEVRPSEITSERDWLDRRRFLAALAGAGAALAGCGRLFGATRREDLPPLAVTPSAPLYPARRNLAFALDRPLTDEVVAATTNNFYEFTTDKGAVWKVARGFAVRPWTVEIAGLVDKPFTIGIDDLQRKVRLEERLYRHRCVEAWAMAVPWTGFALADLLRLARPLAAATHVAFTSFLRPEQAPGQKRQRWYRWPYYEGLTLAEAAHPLAFLATGIYGHELPVQHGAPIRLVVPWKYGFKSIKSITRIEFSAGRPPTFWNDAEPGEYDFAANVDPAVPHPRWSQATETMIGTGERRPTLPFNGYAAEVAGLYAL